ncbi:anti-apoptotic Bcl-2-like protein [Yokapox virus]|uniref:Anti-apoptotic Bcl-2-like protein n=1 Tax=Yokapox virus TaxID=1076255 RepID=G3EI91_9POXV|nr:anti-apoptotic Bcl-2-like protein [Yokapox virus]AEN03602.1 anti-apoptotic Bcl-2-like protein [Yokapox virus]
MKDLIRKYIIWRNDKYFFSEDVPNEFKVLDKWDMYSDDVDIHDIVKKMKLSLNDGPRVDRINEEVNSVTDAKRIISIAAKVSEYIGNGTFTIKWDESFNSLYNMIDKYMDELKMDVYTYV